MLCSNLDECTIYIRTEDVLADNKQVLVCAAGEAVCGGSYGSQLGGNTAFVNVIIHQQLPLLARVENL